MYHLMGVKNVRRGFIDVFSRRTTGFSQVDKTNRTELLCEKHFLLDNQTSQFTQFPGVCLFITQVLQYFMIDSVILYGNDLILICLHLSVFVKTDIASKNQ